jgi:hypothetical protein
MQTHEDRSRGWLLWPAAVDGLCAVIIVSFVFVALGYLHPILALLPIGLGILGVLARPARVHDAVPLPPSSADDPLGDVSESI